MCFRCSSNTTDLVEATLDFGLPRSSLTPRSTETPASPENSIHSEVSHVVVSEQLATETGPAVNNEEMRTDGLPTLENVSPKIHNILDNEPTAESETMTSKPEVDDLLDSFDRQSLVNVAVESQSTTDMVLKSDEVASEIEPSTEKATCVNLDQETPTKLEPKSPPIVSKSSYVIDWDKFDESMNPFETHVRLGNSPSGGSGQKAPSGEALNPFKSGKTLHTSPQPSSKHFGFTGGSNKAKEAPVCSSSNVESDEKQDDFSALSSDALKPISTNEATKSDCKASDSAARYV